MKKFIIAICLILSPAIASAAAATCNAANVGTTQCMGQKQCECKFFRKSEMAGTPDRFSWDCGILQPTCSNGNDNVTIQTPYNGPASVGYGVNTTNTTLSNTPVTSQSQSPSTTLNQQQQSPTTTNSTTTTQVPTVTNTQTPSQTSNQNSTQNH